MSIQATSIPRELTDRHQWVLWRYETRDGKQTKIPYSAMTNRRAESDNPSTWTDYEKAFQSYERGGYDGVGYMLAPPYVGIDLDHCIDPDTGEIKSWASEIMDDFAGAYVEISPSGTGLHIICKGKAPHNGRKGHQDGTVEVYGQRRYFTITGRALRAPGTIGNCQDALSKLHELVWQPRLESLPEVPRRGVTPSNLEDQAVLDRAFRASNGAMTERLYNGDASGYASASEADQALTSRLAFYTQDHNQLVRLLQGSGLWDKKWERQDYQDRTISKALEGLTEVYSGNGASVAFSLDGREIAPVDPPAETRAEAFPLEALPDSLSAYIQLPAESIGCPVDLVAIPALVLAATAIGNTRVLEIKPGWIEGARFYAAIVVPPGGKKSPALHEAARPVYQKENEFAECFTERQQAYAFQQTEYQTALEVWKIKKGRSATDKPIEPPEPHLERVYTQDVTVEALAELLQVNPRGLAIIRDELTGWVRAMDQYKGGKGADRQYFLSFWNGSPVTVDRKGKPPVRVSSPFLNVVGAIPPDVLNELSDEQGREDGFVHRLLFAYPEPITPSWSDTGIEPAARQNYESMFIRLWGLEGEGGGPKAVHFTSDARAEWISFYNSHNAEIASLPANLQGPWAKLEAYCARLALVTQLLRYACDETTREDVELISLLSAIALVDYFKAHTRRVYDRLHSTRKEQRLKEAAAWIRKQKDNRTTLRGVMRAGVCGCKLRDEALRLLEDLEAAGYGVKTITQKQGGTSVGFQLSVG